MVVPPKKSETPEDKCRLCNVGLDDFDDEFGVVLDAPVFPAFVPVPRQIHAAVNVGRLAENEDEARIARARIRLRAANAGEARIEHERNRLRAANRAVLCWFVVITISVCASFAMDTWYMAACLIAEFALLSRTTKTLRSAFPGLFREELHVHETFLHCIVAVLLAELLRFFATHCQIVVFLLTLFWLLVPFLEHLRINKLDVRKVPFFYRDLLSSNENESVV